LWTATIAKWDASTASLSRFAVAALEVGPAVLAHRLHPILGRWGAALEESRAEKRGTGWVITEYVLGSAGLLERLGVAVKLLFGAPRRRVRCGLGSTGYQRSRSSAVEVSRRGAEDAVTASTVTASLLP
jgi:hypothetical protein